jgi:hypothetical protein
MPELAKRCRVDARECADMIIGARPDVLRAKGIASQICYSATSHVAVTKFTTDVVCANPTRMDAVETTSHVAAPKFTTDVVCANSTSMNAAEAAHVASAEAAHVASAKATYMAPAKATYVAPAKATAACIRRIDTEAAAQDCEC